MRPAISFASELPPTKIENVRRLDDTAHVEIIKRQRLGSDHERKSSRFAGLGRHALESFQLPHRSRNTGGIVLHVELHDFIAQPGARRSKGAPEAAAEEL